jgi:four helix bundle protein
MVESYRDLKVWQRAIEMTLTIYRVTAGFPKEELFGLTSQIRRASVSVASNIAEGYGRGSKGDIDSF